MPLAFPGMAYFTQILAFFTKILYSSLNVGQATQLAAPTIYVLQFIIFYHLAESSPIQVFSLVFLTISPIFVNSTIAGKLENGINK